MGTCGSISMFGSHESLTSRRAELEVERGAWALGYEGVAIRGVQTWKQR